MIKYFAGIDVQIKRGCCYYIIDENKKYVDSDWIKDNISQSLKEIFLRISNNNTKQIAIGIDAPRMPIKKLRKRRWLLAHHAFFVFCLIKLVYLCNYYLVRI